MYGLAASLAVAIAFIPAPANSDSYTTDGPKRTGPRWSNDHHQEHGLIVRPDCVGLPPGASAEYVPGIDPWGHPITPAEQPKGFSDSFPVQVDLDVKLGSRYIAGKEIEMNAGHFTFDPATSELALNGRTWQRDCHPSPK